ncbi:MAG TPA: hypothetical protein P5346_07175 [Spirochaetota bacterium]|nr:hypothetical protein [Spirochaetota bacterium]
MKYLKDGKFSMILIFGLTGVLVLGCLGILYGEIDLNTFSPGTTISSGDVNDNFNQLYNGLSRMKFEPGSQSEAVTLTAEAQNIKSITVTPPEDGVIMILGQVNITIVQGSSGGGTGWGYSGGTVYISTTSNGTDNGQIFCIDTPDTKTLALYAPRVNWPTTVYSFHYVTANTPVTFYMTAIKGGGSVGSINIWGSMTAIFFPAVSGL